MEVLKKRREMTGELKGRKEMTGELKGRKEMKTRGINRRTS